MQPKLQPGQVWTSPRYYQDANGIWHRKHTLVLAVDEYDVTQRPFTKVTRGRSVVPPCGHEPHNHPGYFVGAGVFPVLHLPTWVDLEFRDDVDIQHWERMFSSGQLTYVGTLSTQLFCAVLLCAAGADGTTERQRRKIMAVRGALGCQ